MSVSRDIINQIQLSHQWRLLAKAEHSGVAQTEGGDSGLFTQRGLIITVPANAVMAIAIQVT